MTNLSQNGGDPPKESEAARQPVSRKDRLPRILEWGAAILLTALAVYVRLVFMRHAGPLWRDEVISLHMVQMPSLSDLWNHLEFDSFPILWYLPLRAYVLMGPGQTDFGLRVLGCFFSVLILWALWWNARRCGYRLPILSMLLIGLSPTFILWAGSSRAFGLGVALTLLTFGATWMVVEKPSRKRVALAAIIALLGVQCLYYNLVATFIFCFAGAVVALRKGGLKAVIPFVVIGIAAVLPMAAYVGIIHRLHTWNIVVQRPIDFAWVWMKFSQGLASAGLPMYFFTLGVCVVSVGAALIFQNSSARWSVSAAQRDMLLYAGIVLVAGTGGYLLFIRQLKYPTQPWYYTVLYGMMAVSVDAIIGTLAQSARLRVIQASIAVAAAILIAGPVYNASRTRLSNVDAVAKEVGGLSAPGDLIVVAPWYLNVPFNVYYKGAAQWTTLPAIPYPSYFRYDLFKEKMASERPIEDVLDRMNGTLRSGHRVWIVGDMPILPPGRQPGYLPPAPQSPYGWNDGTYMTHWIYVAAYDLQTHALHERLYPKPSVGPVSGYEDIHYIMFEGTQATPGSQECRIERP
jgi:hypothetical protein